MLERQCDRREGERQKQQGSSQKNLETGQHGQSVYHIFRDLSHWRRMLNVRCRFGGFGFFMNLIGKPLLPGQEAQLDYGHGEFRVIRQGAFVRCA
ncbi:MAG: hypothetical protein ACRDBH_09455, partial [Bosea sp. (in: a-proteobacteria)]